MADVLRLAPETIVEMSEHAQKVFPEECCGVILEKDGKQIVKICRNIQDEKRKENPDVFQATAERGYYMDPEDLREIMLLEREQYEMSAIYHSHPNMKAYFSAADRDRAVWDKKEDEVLFPGVRYIVISVFADGVKDIKVFAWDEKLKDFVEVQNVSL